MAPPIDLGRASGHDRPVSSNPLIMDLTGGRPASQGGAAAPPVGTPLEMHRGGGDAAEQARWEQVHGKAGGVRERVQAQRLHHERHLP